MESVTTFFKEENDVFYRRGAKKKAHAIVVNLIQELGMSDEKAAKIAEVTVEFVASVRLELTK